MRILLESTSGEGTKNRSREEKSDLQFQDKIGR